MIIGLQAVIAEHHVIAWFDHGGLGFQGASDAIVFFSRISQFGFNWFRSWISTTDENVFSGTSAISVLFSCVGVVVIGAAVLSACWTGSAGLSHLNWSGIRVVTVWTVSFGAGSALEARILFSWWSLLHLHWSLEVMTVGTFRVDALSALEAWLLWWLAGTDIGVMGILALRVLACISFEAGFLSGFLLLVISGEFHHGAALELLTILWTSLAHGNTWWRRESLFFGWSVMEVATSFFPGAVWTVATLFLTLMRSWTTWTTVWIAVSWSLARIGVSELTVFLDASLAVLAGVLWKGFLG